MLCKDPFIIKPETFTLIQELQSLDVLKEFYLVGGTALALKGLEYFGDIDPNIDPPILKKPIALSKIKKRIIEGILHINKTF